MCSLFIVILNHTIEPQSGRLASNLSHDSKIVSSEFFLGKIFLMSGIENCILAGEACGR